MFYVYILRSKRDTKRLYKGVTKDIVDRLDRHNRGEVSHTSKFCPWELVFYAAFNSKKKAYSFERYLKSGSGIAFMRKRLLPPNTPP